MPEPDTTPVPCEYEQTTGHEITCSSGFNDTCTCGAAPAGPAEPVATGNPAYDAVYAHIRSLGDHMPPSTAHRNAMIWRTVEAALRAERAAVQRRLIAAFQTDPDPHATEAWTRGHRAGLTTAMDALHATPTQAPAAPAAPEGDQRD